MKCSTERSSSFVPTNKAFTATSNINISADSTASNGHYDAVDSIAANLASQFSANNTPEIDANVSSMGGGCLKHLPRRWGMRLPQRGALCLPKTTSSSNSFNSKTSSSFSNNYFLVSSNNKYPPSHPCPIPSQFRFPSFLMAPTPISGVISTPLSNL